MINNIPKEVEIAMVVNSGMGPFVGMKLYNEVVETINKYPEYFPWEHKWRTIPEEVHKAYLTEINEAAEKNAEKIRKQRNKLSKKYETKSKKFGNGFTIDELNTLINHILEQSALTRKQKKNWENIDKRMWKKHYKKYNLKYKNNDRFM